MHHSWLSGKQPDLSTSLNFSPCTPYRRNPTGGLVTARARERLVGSCDRKTTPNLALQRNAVPNRSKIRVGQVVNIHRPDMCRKDARHRDDIYPHLIIEMKRNSFVAVPFSSSYDCFAERVISERIPKEWGSRSRDGWIAANRIKEFPLNTNAIADFWGYIPSDAPVWSIVWKVIRRYLNYLDTTGSRRPPFVPREQRGRTVAVSSYERYCVR